MDAVLQYTVRGITTQSGRQIVCERYETLDTAHPDARLKSESGTSDFLTSLVPGARAFHRFVPEANAASQLKWELVRWRHTMLLDLWKGEVGPTKCWALSRATCIRGSYASAFYLDFT